MAILKNLVVNGASRFLQKAYFSDIEVGGTTTMSDLAAETLSVSGGSTFNGEVDIKYNLDIKSPNHTINFHYDTTKSAITSQIYESSSGVLKIYPNLDVTSGTTTLRQLVVNSTSNFGDKVRIDGDVDIIGGLRWSTVAEHMTIQNLGGTLLVAPTVYGGTETTVTIISISGTTVTLTVYDPNIKDTTGSSTVQDYWTAGGANWRNGSKVKLSGAIDTCVLGASDGTMTKVNLSTHTMQITAIIANANRLTQGVTYPAAELKDFAIMLYKVKSGDYLYPIGLVLTSYGENRLSYVDVYGGTDANPVARMGNLGNLKYRNKTTGTDTTLNYQWGFYTKGNAWLEGYIVADAGIIGGWEISASHLSKGNFADPDNGSVFLIPGGSGNTMANNGQAAIGGSAANKSGWVITSRNTFGVNIDGGLYVTYGKIAGWDITGNYIKYKDLAQTNSMILSPTGYRKADVTIGGSTGNTWTIAIDDSFGVDNVGRVYSTAGKIGNWIIASDKLYSGNTAVLGSSGIFLIPGGSSSTASIAGSSSISGWAITAGDSFGVTTNGALYADSANIEGTITATGGKIGGFTINSTAIYSGSAVGAVTSGAVALSTNDFSRKLSGDSSNTTGLRFAIGDNFAVSNTGVVYAHALQATGGNIGGWTINSTSLYKGTFGASGGVYLIPNGSAGNAGTASIAGSESISGWAITAGSTFGVTTSGDLYTTSIKATGGKIGGFTIDGDSIYAGTKNPSSTPAYGDVRLSSTVTFTREIGGESQSNLRFAIGPGFGVTAGGQTYMGTAYAKDFKAYRSYKIHGNPIDDGATTGEDFEIIRAGANTSTGSGTPHRAVGFGMIFANLNNDTFYWKDPRPELGVRFERVPVEGGTNLAELYAKNIRIHGTMNPSGDYNIADSVTIETYSFTVRSGSTSQDLLQIYGYGGSGDIRMNGFLGVSSDISTSGNIRLDNYSRGYNVTYQDSSSSTATATAVSVKSAMEYDIPSDSSDSSLNNWIRYGTSASACLLTSPTSTRVYVKAHSETSSGVKLYNLGQCLEKAMNSSSGGGTIIDPYTSTPQAIGTSGSAGSSPNYARGDHKHAISVSEGSTNGYITIAGQSVKVHGINSAAYKADSYFATAGHTHNSMYVPFFTKLKINQAASISSPNVYLLICSHGASNVDSNARGLFIIRPDDQSCSTLVKAPNLTITVTSTSVKVTSSGGTPGIYLLNIGQIPDN